MDGGELIVLVKRRPDTGAIRCGVHALSIDATSPTPSTCSRERILGTNGPERHGSSRHPPGGCRDPQNRPPAGSLVTARNGKEFATEQEVGSLSPFRRRQHRPGSATGSGLRSRRRVVSRRDVWRRNRNDGVHVPQVDQPAASRWALLWPCSNWPRPAVTSLARAVGDVGSAVRLRHSGCRLVAHAQHPREGADAAPTPQLWSAPLPPALPAALPEALPGAFPYSSGAAGAWQGAIHLGKHPQPPRRGSSLGTGRITAPETDTHPQVTGARSRTTSGRASLRARLWTRERPW
jgi:hypothetical protein